MIGYIVKKLIGSKNDREVKRVRRDVVPRINELELQYQSLSVEQLRAKTGEFRQRIEDGRKQRGYYEVMEQARQLDAELRGDEAKTERRKAFDIEQQILKELLPEAFAAVKNACRRLCGNPVVVRGHEGHGYGRDHGYRGGYSGYYDGPSYYPNYYVEPVYVEPAYVEPTYVEPGYVEPAYTDPEPAYDTDDDGAVYQGDDGATGAPGYDQQPIVPPQD